VKSSHCPETALKVMGLVSTVVAMVQIKAPGIGGTD